MMRRWCRVMAASGVVVGLGWGPPAVANEATALGKEYSDTDSRYAAREMRERLAALGYAATQDLNGRSALETHRSVRRSSVFFFSGHGTGAYVLADGSNLEDDPNAQWLGAGVAGNTPWCTGVVVDDFTCTGTTAWLSQATYVDLDDTRLLIAKGCDTADLFTNMPEFGSFRQISEDRGIDSFLGWSGTVYTPSAGQPIEQTNYSGNYFAERMAVYLERGHSYRVSVDRAVTDLVAKEGNASGYKAYVFDGALSDPGSPTLGGAPAGVSGNGAPLAAAGVGPATALPVTGAASSTTGHPTYGTVAEHVTDDGVSYRTTLEGRLLDLSGVAAVTGPEVIDHKQAQQVARDFIDSHVVDAPGNLALHQDGQISHMAGDALSEFEWRPLVDGVPGPRSIRVEIDRRTGEVVSFYDVAASPATTAFVIDHDSALERAAQVVAAGGAVTVERDVWGVSRWTVTFDRGVDAQGFRDADRVVVDAATGEVLQHDAV